MKLTWMVVALGASVMIGGSGARAEDVEGQVQAAGSSINVEVFLVAPGEKTGPHLCPGDVMKRVRRLGGMTARVSGEWQLGKDGGKKCFVAKDFTVLKTSSGQDAVVGTLSQKDGAYVVSGDGGKSMTLSEVPGGLKKLEGQKVILGLSPIESPAAKGPTYKVATYAVFP